MRCTCPAGLPRDNPACPVHSATERGSVAVECEFGVGVGTPDLKVRVRFNPDKDERVEAYPQAAGQLTGEAGRVERALEDALQRVREARRRYSYGRFDT